MSSKKNEDFDDITTIASSGLNKIPWLLIILITVIYLLVDSTQFNIHVLRNIQTKNMQFINESDEKTPAGFVASGLILGSVSAILYALGLYI